MRIYRLRTNTKSKATTYALALNKAERKAVRYRGPRYVATFTVNKGKPSLDRISFGHGSVSLPVLECVGVALYYLTEDPSLKLPRVEREVGITFRNEVQEALDADRETANDDA